MPNLKYNFIPILASICSVIAFSMLTFNVHTSKKTEHLGYTILLLILAAQLLLFLNGILTESVIIYVPAMIIIGLLIYVIYIKFSNEL